MTQGENDDFIFITEAAALLDINTRALLTLIDQRQLPAYKVAGRIGIRRSDIKKFRRGNTEQE